MGFEYFFNTAIMWLGQIRDPLRIFGKKRHIFYISMGFKSIVLVAKMNKHQKTNEDWWMVSAEGGCVSAEQWYCYAPPSLLTEPFPVFDLKSLFRANPLHCSAFMSQVRLQRDEGRSKIQSSVPPEAVSICRNVQPAESFILLFEMCSLVFRSGTQSQQLPMVEAGHQNRCLWVTTLSI